MKDSGPEASLLQGQRRLAQMGEDAAEIVVYPAHDEAVEQRDAPPAAGAGQDASCRQKPEILQCPVEARLPPGGLGLDGGEGAGHTAPGVLDRLVDRRAVLRFEPVFGVPDLAGDRRDLFGGCGFGAVVTGISMALSIVWRGRPSRPR